VVFQGHEGVFVIAQPPGKEKHRAQHRNVPKERLRTGMQTVLQTRGSN
jgi:hypothetical protein